MTKKIIRRASSNDPFNGMNMGDKVTDTLSGFTGLVVARVEYLTGCNQLLILPRSPEDNDIKGAHWFDIERCELVEAGCVEVRAAPTGRDMPLPDKR